MSVVLYDYWRSTASYRVRIALHLGGIAFRSIAVDLLNGEQFAARHLDRNPQGLVPVLDIDGLRLTQSLAILEYLDETRSLGLVPTDPAGRARVRILAQVIAADTHPVCTPSVVIEVLRHTSMAEPARTEWMRRFIRRGLGAFEALLAQAEPGAFCHGDQPTLADLCLVPQLYNANRWGVCTDDLPRISRIAATCSKHPSFVAAAPGPAPT